MKNKLMLTILPLLALASCGSNPQVFTPYVDYVNGMPTVHNAPGDGNLTVYLMLSPKGYIEVNSAKTTGVDVPEKFYENCIAWEGAKDSSLPVAKTDVSGATFRGWAYYNEDNENVWPDYYDKLETGINGLALKAIFDGTSAGSGGGGGGGSSLPTSGYGLLMSDGSYALGTHKGTNDDGKDEYLCASVKFTADTTVQMYDFGTSTGWIVTINSYSFGDTGGTGTAADAYLSVGVGKWTVKKDFTADVYIQLKMNDDTIYFELK